MSETIFTLEELILQQDAEIKRIFEGIGAQKRELSESLTAALRELNADAERKSLGEISSRVTTIRQEFGELMKSGISDARRDLRKVLIEMSDGVKSHLLGEQAAALDKLDERLIRHVDESAVTWRAHFKSEFEKETKASIVRLFDEQPKPGFMQFFKGNWRQDLVLKAGDLFGFRGSTYLAMKDTVGIAPNSKNQRGPDAIFQLVAAAGAPGPQFPGGSSGSGLPDQAGQSGKFLTTNGTIASWASLAGGGDVVGPASAVDGHVVLFDGTSGTLIKDGGGLGTAAFTAASAYATAAQGTKADSALQPNGDGSGLTNLSKGQVGLGSVTNDAQTKAAIVPNTAPTAGQILAGNAGGTAYAPVSVSGDASLSSAGALALATVNSNVGAFGSATKASVVTVNAKGLVTASSESTVTPAVGSITGLGTGIATALAINAGSAGAPVLLGGALGTPSGGTLTNATGLPVSGLAAGTLAVSPVFGENTALVLVSALSADGKYCGIVEAGTADATIAFGDLCYFKASNSRWALADADADSTAGAVMIAICVLASTSGNTTTVLRWGKIRADAKFPALTIGGPAYVSGTSGTIQTTQPSSTDQVIRIVGYGCTGDELLFQPSNDYMTHV